MLSLLIPKSLGYHFVNLDPAGNLENYAVLTVPRLSVFQFSAFLGYVYAKAKILSQLATCRLFYFIQHLYVDLYLVLVIGPSIHRPNQDLLLRRECWRH